MWRIKSLLLLLLISCSAEKGPLIVTGKLTTITINSVAHCHPVVLTLVNNYSKIQIYDSLENNETTIKKYLPFLNKNVSIRAIQNLEFGFQHCDTGIIEIKEEIK